MPRGFMIVGKSKVIDLHITDAILKYRNPYHKLVKLLFKFSALNINPKNKLYISLKEVEIYFGLQKEHAEEVLKSLVNDEFLFEYDGDEKKAGEKIFFLNKDAIISLEEDPYKEITKDIDYYFSRFPRLCVPEYLFGFKEIKKSEDLLSLIPELDLNTICTPNNRELLRIPEQFIKISEGGLQKHSEMKTPVQVRIIPETKNGDFKCSLFKKSRLKWPEKDRIIENDHPDYELIKNRLKTIDIERFIEIKLPPQENDFKYQLKFNDKDFSWSIIVNEISEKKTDLFLRKLEKLKYRFDLRNVISEINIKVLDLSLFNDYLKNIVIKCRIKILISEKVAFSFFAEYLARSIFDFQIKYKQIIPLIKKFYEKFLDFFNLEKKLFPLPSINDLKRYYWDTEKYRMAYLLMYGDDLL